MELLLSFPLLILLAVIIFGFKSFTVAIRPALHR